MVWVIAFGELFFGDLWCVVWGYGGMRTHFSLLNPQSPRRQRRDARCDLFHFLRVVVTQALRQRICFVPQ